MQLIVEIVPFFFYFLQLAQQMCGEVILRFTLRSDPATQIVGKRSRTSTFDKTKGFNDALITVCQAKLNELVVRRQVIRKESSAKFLAWNRRQHVFRKIDRLFEI